MAQSVREISWQVVLDDEQKTQVMVHYLPGVKTQMKEEHWSIDAPGSSPAQISEAAAMLILRHPPQYVR